MFGLGTTEIILILAAVLILFGARKIPEFARGMGQGIREFRSAARDVQKDIDREIQTERDETTKKEQSSSKKS